MKSFNVYCWGKEHIFFYRGSKLAAAGSIYFLAFFTANSLCLLWSMICKLPLLFMCSTITASDTSPSPALSHKCEGNKRCLLWQPAFCLWSGDKLHPWQLATGLYCFSPHSLLECSQEDGNRWNWIKMLSASWEHSFASQGAPLGTCVGWGMGGPSLGQMI